MKLLIRKHSHQHAQSFVEFALTLPILLLIVVGLMEVANLIGIHTRLLATSREGARIAAAGGTDSIVVSTTVKSSEGMLNSSGHMEVWIVRPIVRTSPWRWEGGTGWGSAGETCIYPLDSGNNPACKNTSSGIDPNRVLGDIRQINSAQAARIDGEQLVVVAVYYEARSILALPYFNVASGQTSRVPMRSYSVMRQEVVEQTVNQLSGGCSAYPIALRTSVQTTNGNTPASASEGEIFANIAKGNSGFLYLLWRDGGSGLGTTLPYPGDESLTEYINPAVPTDVQIQRQDWVMVQTNLAGVMNANALPDHRAKNRALRVILYDQDASLVNGKFQIQIAGFAIVRIAEHNASGDLISFQFVRIDTSCGFN